MLLAILATALICSGGGYAIGVCHSRKLIAAQAGLIRTLNKCNAEISESHDTMVAVNKGLIECLCDANETNESLMRQLGHDPFPD